jgi:hypothetical protein
VQLWHLQVLPADRGLAASANLGVSLDAELPDEQHLALGRVLTIRALIGGAYARTDEGITVQADR